MKKKILCLALACFIVLMSLPLSALAEDGQTEEKANNEIITEMPAAPVKNANDENVDQSKEAIVPDEMEGAVTDKNKKTEAEEALLQEKETTQEKDNALDENKQLEKSSKEDETTVKKEINAAGASFTEGEFTFREYPSGISIINYSGQSEKVVVPGQTKDGRKVRDIEQLWDKDNVEGKNKVQSIVFSEGIETIGYYVLQGDGSALANLKSIELPTTTFYSVRISNTGLTNLDGFAKASQLEYIYVTNSRLTDISALEKMDKLRYLDLQNNPDLEDISILKTLRNLNNLYLKGTKVSEQDQLDLLNLPEEMKVSTGLSSTFRALPRLDLELDATIGDATLAELTMKNSNMNIRGIKAGKTEGVISVHSNPSLRKSFPIAVNALEPSQPTGDKIENIPEIQKSYKASPKTLGDTELLELYDNGDLWRVDGEKQEKLLGNIDNYVGAQVYNNSEHTWTLAQDKNKSLWVYENRVDGTSNVEKRLENVTKYSGLYELGADNVERACAIDGSQNLWQIDSNGGKVKLMDKVQDFVVLPFRGRSEVAALNTGGELYLCDMVTQSSTKIADQVTAVQPGVIREDTEVYRYSVFSFVQNGALWGFRDAYIDPSDYQKGSKTETYLISGNAVAVMDNFVVKADGTTWYQKGNLNCQILDKPIKDWSAGRVLDSDNILWLVKSSAYLNENETTPQVVTEKVAENVKKLHFGSGRDIFKGYILENGDYYNSDQEKVNTNVLDVSDVNGFDNCYYLKQDHVVYLNDVAILDHVIRIVKESDYHGNFVRTLMFRDDGSCWASELESDPTPYKLADYQKKITVTGIKLSLSTLTLTQNYTVQLQVTIEPENATNQTVLWTSSHPDIASVENGLVTGVKEGEAVIIATTEDGGKTAECKVSVKKAAPVLNPDSGTAEGITAGETGQAFAEKLKDSGAIEDKNHIKLYKADGQEVSLDTKLATGMKVVVTIGQKMFNRNAGTQEYTVIVLGDISGDGIINIMDMLAAQDDILGKEKLEGCYRTAGDITKDSNINIMDMLAIQDDILGKEKINPYV